VPAAGGCAEQLTTFEDDAVRGAFSGPGITVSPDGSTLVILADADGNENSQLYKLAAERGWPEKLTDEPRVQNTISHASFSPDAETVAFTSNARTPQDMDLRLLDVETGDSRLLFGEDKFLFPGSWSPDGSKLTVVDLRMLTDMSIYVVDVATGEGQEITPHEGDAKFMPGPWAPDGSGFYVITDEGREFSGLAFQHLDGTRDWVEAPEADVESVALSADGRVLGWTVNDRGYARLRLRDVERGEDLPEPKLPDGCTHFLGAALKLSRDGRRAVLMYGDPRRPFELHAVDTATGDARALTQNMLGGLAEQDLTAPELVSYRTFDGREVPAWLYRPEGNGPSPAVLSIHGGPDAQERPWYQPLYQYLVSRGIGVLATNIRGSTGYGKAYQKLVHHDWGGGDLKDMEHAALWLRDQDWVDADRIGVFGGSYGGFATLSCVTRLPDYWAAAAEFVGPSNLITFAKAVPPSWQRMMDEWLGDPETEADFLTERSPITYVENVRTPLLVLQGANDPRVVKPESDQMVERLRELGRTVEYVVFEDEGHGFTKRRNQQRAYRLVADWLERYLVGEREPEVALAASRPA
jgi:dipeptidyl aminopeptidase/acylaminoacyl peptidase